MTKVVVVIGPGSIGQAVARRVGAGKHLVLADLRQDNADAAAKTLSEAGFKGNDHHCRCAPPAPRSRRLSK